MVGKSAASKKALVHLHQSASSSSSDLVRRSTMQIMKRTCHAEENNKVKCDETRSAASKFEDRHY